MDVHYDASLQTENPARPQPDVACRGMRVNNSQYLLARQSGQLVIPRRIAACRPQRNGIVWTKRPTIIGPGAQCHRENASIESFSKIRRS